MKRTPFKRKLPASTAKPARARPVHTRLAVNVNMPRVTGEVITLAKDVPVRSEPYRRLVAAGPCKVCGIVGYSQAAHPNTGKGTGMKTDDRLCFALCTVHPGADGQLVQGCHEKFDQGALFTQAVRRELEPAWAADTQRQVTARGEWPKNLPKPEERAGVNEDVRVTRPACFPAQTDYDDWRALARNAREQATPCTDCLKPYKAAMLAVGRCDAKQVKTIFLHNPKKEAVPA